MNHNTNEKIWFRDAIFYQIFPDRFFNGDRNNDPMNVDVWGSKPTRFNVMGGDLQGIIDKLTYLTDIGINAIYLNPIFLSSSNHKYNTYNYYAIDYRFGSFDIFCKLVQLCHEFQIRVVLDGVFHHCGRGFYQFHDVMENNQYSAYQNWFHIKDFPIDAYGEYKYEAWHNSRNLPKFNLTNPQVRKYLLDVACYWIEKGADGWRLDAAGDVTDHDLWKEMRQAIKLVNPNAYLLGEVWRDGTPWLQGDQFDGITNYVLRDIILNFFISESIRSEEFSYRLQNLLSAYSWSATESMYNLLGSHDTPRILTLAHGDITKVKLAVLFLFAFPGSPSIYYGDEVGMLGGNDPDNRCAMSWDETSWNVELQSFYKRMIAIRKETKSLRCGDWSQVFTDDSTNFCVFVRRADEDVSVVLFNNGSQAVTLNIPVEYFGLPIGIKYFDKVNDLYFDCDMSQLIITDYPPKHGSILVPLMDK